MPFRNCGIGLHSVAYAGFWKGGGGGQEIQKIWEQQESEWKFFHPESVRFSCPKWDEDQKKKYSLNFSRVFCPKLSENQKKGRHSNLVRFSAQIWMQAKNKGLRLLFVCSNLLPKLQRGGACRNFAYCSVLIILSWRSKGGPWPNAPP